MKLSIELKSFSLPSSGEGDVLIDSDVQFHKTGFPYLSGRRIKGLFKESLIETLEIKNYSKSDIKIISEALFGGAGEAEIAGKLQFSNAFLAGWDIIKKRIKIITQLKDPRIIKEFFTEEISQTALDDEGIAKFRSLRTYRVLKPIKDGSKFESEVSGNLEKIITTHRPPLDKKDIEEILTDASHNLRFMGTRRNRGFGKIKCSIDFKVSKNGKEDDINSLSIKGGVNVRITTKSPVVLSRQFGDQNTVGTDQHISGNRLRGLLVDQFIAKHPLSDQENMKLFRNIFLSGKIQFSTLYFSDAEPIPLNIHYKKNEGKDGPYTDIFKSKDNEITRSLKETGKLILNTNTGLVDKKKPDTSFNFHNTRQKNRLAGRNRSEDEGGIFYYESLDEDQEFNGTITGDESLIKNLVEITGSSFHTYIGRSKSAQYAEVDVQFLEKETSSTEIEPDSHNHYLLYCQSPLILFNKEGIPEPNGVRLAQYLKDAEINCTIENVAAEFTVAEQYNVMWKSKSDKTNCFKEGTSFLLKRDGHSDFKTITENGLGEWKEQGFGKVEVKAHGQFPLVFLKVPEKKKENNENEDPDVKMKRQLLGEVKEDIPVLDLLKDYIEDQENEIQSKKLAIEKALSDHKDKKRNIKNHLIGRMISIVKQAASQNEIDSYIKELNGKPAFKSLLNARLIDKDDKFLFARKENNKKIELDKIFWITYFQSLRKLNSKSDNNG